MVMLNENYDYFTFFNRNLRDILIKFNDADFGLFS